MIFFVNILTILLCFPWPVIFMFSPMGFDAPGSMTFERMASVTLICLYPALLGILYLVFGWKFFGMSSRVTGGLLIMIPLAGIFLFGYPRSTYLLWKGIPLHGYAVVKDKVYYQGADFDADPRTFQVIDSIFCAKDAQRVYNYGHPIPDADPDTFEKIADTTYYKDKNYVYARRGAYIEKIPGIRGEKFQQHPYEHQGTLYPSRYSSDGVTAYYSFLFEKVEGLDASKIWVKGAYAGDGERVYHQGKKLEADSSSFVVLIPGETNVQDGQGLAKDKNSVFFRNVAQDADAGSFELLERRYARDKRRVYYINESFEVVKDASPSSFKVILEGYDEDALDGEKKIRSGKPYQARETH